MNVSDSSRLVAIVGRPNVGKSALFNRFVRRRLAIVHEQSGVTRDRLQSEVQWGETRFDLVDTGGIGYLDGEQPHDIINAGILNQVEAAISDAAILLFVVDATTGCVPLDESLAAHLHDSGRPVFLLANKCDNENIASQTLEFEKLGFPVFPVSALHGTGLEALMDSLLPRLPEQVNLSIKEPLKVAIVGRPNAGKSSYINRLINDERVIVSDIPGTTRDAIEIPFSIGQGPAARHYTLIDTAGMKKKGRARDTVESFSYIRTERAIERADVVVLVLDAAEGPKEREKKLTALIKDKEKGCLILVNKWDLAEGITTQRKYGEALREALPYLDFVPVLFASASSGYNIKKTIEAIDYVAEQVSTTISTGVLNRILLDAFEQTPPPRVKNSRAKLFYCTQVSACPIRIKLFVNDPKKIPNPYKSYLINTLRKKFGLEGAPIRLLFSARKSLYKDP